MNLPSRGGVCGLHLSSRCGHANAVELLLDKGTIHIRDHPYITSAKRWFVGGGGQMLIFAGLGISMCGLHLSARCGHANRAELLLVKGTIKTNHNKHLSFLNFWI